mgnify:CR=1 FL=1
MHMAGRPASMSELARRLAISRQAVHKTVAELVRRGILEVRADPERRNQRLVVYTAKGKQVNRSGVRIIESIEQRIAKRLATDPLDIGIVVDYLRRKEEEAAQLRLLARGKFYGVPRETLAKELTRA